MTEPDIVLEDGADVELKSHDDLAAPTRVEIRGDWVTMYFEYQYEKWVVHSRDVVAMMTHTTDEEEDSEWFR